MSVLGSTATKREARSYLKAFTPPKEVTSKSVSHSPKSGPKTNGVNLGNFYGSIRSVEESPKFVQKPVPDYASAPSDPPLHLALVKLRSPQTLTDETLLGIGRTFTQLAKLGLHSVVVVDCNDSPEKSLFDQPGWKNFIGDQCDRLVAAIEANDGGGSRKIDNVLGISDQVQASSVSPVRGNTHVTYRRLLMTPLRRGLIPVIPSMGYTDDTQTGKSLDANDVVMALTREFAGLHADQLPDEDHEAVAARIKQLRKEVSLDRLIILDPLGGIPASHRPDGVHVFLNMEQEYDYVKEELLGGESYYGDATTGKNLRKVQSEESKAHLRNLDIMKATLALLPPTSSALLTTPDEAANSGRQSIAPTKAIGVGTRRLRNPLIHNLLTDKPAFSSSLPVSRLGQLPPQQHPTSSKKPSVSVTTFAKRGIPLTIFPDPLRSPWEPPRNGKPQMTLQDPQIDLPRLVHLIEDSFDRKLDVQDYLKRVNNRTAGVIIAGEYEGGALLTWETPPGVPDDGSEESRARMVPYLDKFAVLKRSQGSGGVADVVFKAMVRDCFPDGVCWRSRQNNPVNKWYFERSRGTWRLPGTNWTMFWTTPDLSLDRQRFLDYERVCDNIEPSWADKKAVVD